LGLTERATINTQTTDHLDVTFLKGPHKIKVTKIYVGTEMKRTK
jgi:hypothetical protein